MAKYKILQEEALINTIVANETFAEEYCAKNGYTYEIIAEPEVLAEPDVTIDDVVEMILEQQFEIALLKMEIEE